ncbi:protein of unknown function UPF0182 [Methanolacinia petrolearia DSM 11571]|uniref:UPF0182 protein Mpet_0004 n=1 Tax=Methanolacinia petrolearia (strain DSM 11571 / OCM 486 / SEBR 4847) TaxID=679926 RepID=E1RCV4_METP4|nr:UPF0182 family protein [Methanolacinia petrolearia]ADN34785.1 protein of unknown function UPF0182 [Methanolacinia petrolearia DSM 11571]
MKLPHIAAAVLLIIGFLFLVTAGFLGEWFWFGSTGYQEVFLTIILARISLFAAAFLIFFAFSFINAWFAAKTASGGAVKNRGNLWIAGALAGLAGLLAALWVSSSWETILKYISQVPFSLEDPVFGLDIGFYIFSLPFYSLATSFAIGLLVFSILLSALSYLLKEDWISFSESGQIFIKAGEAGPDWSGLLKRFLPQLNLLLFLLFAAIAAKLWLARYDLLFNRSGAVFGAGYTDVHVTLPVLTLLTAVALVIGIGFLVNERLKSLSVIKYGIAAFIAIAVVGLLASFAVQGLIVQPNELNLEKQYLENNIEYTLKAYGLSDAEETPFNVSYDLTAQDIEDNRLTAENIRLWDWRPLKSTYEQLQLFRTYYAFNDVDVDRYEINGSYKEVLISAREMDTGSLSSTAQTWVNTHLVYTHGYGVVMTPVDEVTSEGLPEFYIKDIPPSSEYIEIDQPRIYFGEMTNQYIITDTDTEELDYPSGEANVYTSYSGDTGVKLSGIINRLIYGIKFGSLELVVSGSINDESRILMHRNIVDRASAIAPFLSYDNDPYVVVADGKLYWIIDAYTSSDMYPYSEPVGASFINGYKTSYLRNSVKTVVDAYTGEVTYYVIDPDDPVIGTYRKIFPELFRDFSDMPEELKDHIRYAQGLFEIQADRYATYHMKDPVVFYNREDEWVIPDEVYREDREQMQPYYVIMKLPKEDSEEFILMLPFTPIGKENMIGWMAGRSDTPDYGDLIVYQFSKQELTYGPMQIEARIDQDTEISQAITLWSQSGSSVLRGNTLVIPIENSILYVEPLYLQATERGTLPQLKRVIVAYDDRLTMQNTLEEALGVIFGGAVAQEAADAAESGGAGTVVTADSELLQKIAALYYKAQDALANGDLGEYQYYIEEIGKIVTGTA